jgi:cellulose synthase/poly-beta-1,6-N-acetylglucosamine synthase-like glycosyltransferase/peptidoglycan/xylan/chitin deacetylase (PgdA/CDA1 family)
VTVPPSPATLSPGDTAPPPTRRVRRVAPRPRWVVTGVLLFVFVSLLAVEAYANAQFTPDAVHQPGDQATVPQAVLGGGAIINTVGEKPRSYGLPPKTLALTFDDGPDPLWTPKVLEVLGKHQVRATFFVIGSQVSRHPALARRIVADGHEIGGHTFTHPDLTSLPPWRRRMEYSQTQLAIANAAGVQTSLLRFPYCSKADAIDASDWPILQEAGRLGYLVVVNDVDSHDWARPGVDAIVTNLTPAGDAGGVMLLHDAGGDRAQTVAALDRFIPTMKARGYRFTTVGEGLTLALTETTGGTTGAPAAVTGERAASHLERWRGASLIWAVRIADITLDVVGFLFIATGVLTLARTVLLFVLAGRHAARRRSSGWSWGPPVTDPVSVLVPAYNEKEGIAAAVRSLAGGDHGQIEVIVVDDGSTDDTADIAEGLGLPNVRVVRQVNAGKASALNAGTGLATHDLIVMVDGDTVVETDSIRRLVQPFANPSVGAVAGNVKTADRDSLLGLLQHVEYIIGSNLDRRVYETLQCMPTVPGALGAFRREAVVDVGGMSDDTLAEDTDLTMALCRAGWDVVYEERARAWTETPATLDQLWRQRYRWSYGTLQAMWKHRRSVVEGGPSGRFGRRCLPLLALFGVVLPLLGPVIDLVIVYGLFFFDRVEAAVGWLVMLVLQAVAGVIAFRLDREPMRPLWALPLQQFVYRQLLYLVLVQSLVTASTGVRLRWHKLHRTGQAATAEYLGPR